MAKVVILGAGLTGISAAYHLEKKGFTDYKIFEKKSVIGGLCRSVNQDGFTFDFTGHLLHINDPYFRTLIEQLIGIEHFNAIYRKSFVYSQNTYTRYPYQINLFGLPTQTIADCLEGFIKRKQTNKTPATFHEWVLHNFGQGFGNHFFFPYQKKIFAYDTKKITASWTGRFVPATSLNQIIEGALKDSFDTTIGYNSQFFYPKQGGIMFWVHRMADHIQNPIHTNFCAQSIDLKNKTITFTNGHIEYFDQLISTLPLTHLLGCIIDKSSTSFKKAEGKLLCNSVVNFNLGIANPALSDKHWIYFPQSEYPFYRIGFPHNFSTAMAPANCSSLYGEFAYLNRAQRSKNTLLKKAIFETKKLLSIEESHVLTEKIIDIPHAYVIYDHWREKNLTNLLTSLEASSVYSIGRYGEWKYSSMQEAVLDGKKIADSLVILPATRIFYMPTSAPTKTKMLIKEV